MTRPSSVIISDTVDSILEDYAEIVKNAVGLVIKRWGAKDESGVLAIGYFCHAINESREDFTAILGGVFEKTYGENHEAWPKIIKSCYRVFDGVSQYSSNNINEEDPIFVESRKLVADLSDEELKYRISKYLKTAIEDHLQTQYPKYAEVKAEFDQAREFEENNKMATEDRRYKRPREEDLTPQAVVANDFAPGTIFRASSQVMQLKSDAKAVSGAEHF